MQSSQTPGTNRPVWLTFAQSILFTAILPLVIYSVASRTMSTITALLIASIPAIFGTALQYIREHHFDFIGGLSLTALLVKLISLFVFQDSRLVLISDSFVTLTIGSILLVSVAIRKPLLLTILRNMLASMTPTQRENFEKRGFTAGTDIFFSVVTALWGAGLVLEFCISAVLAFTQTAQQFLAISPLVRYGLIGILFVLTRLYRKMSRQNGSVVTKPVAIEES